MFNSKRIALVLVLLFAAQLHAQTKCPPLPEGVTCDRYHFHMAVWNIESRNFTDVAATTQFHSLAACEKARGEALRENAALVEFVKLKVDGSMVANRFGECHCDRTQDAASGVFIDAKTRTAQLRGRQDAAWTLRERLLSRQAEGAGDYLQNLFGHPPRIDRFLRETMPSSVQGTVVTPTVPALLDSKVGSQAPMSIIPANLSLVAIGPAATTGTPQTQPEAVPPATQPPSAPPAGPAAAPSKNPPGNAKGIR